MAVERTLSIIKPDAVEKKKAGAILALLEESGFSIQACKRIHLTKAVAEGFYAVHKARPFFGELVTFMTRGPVFVAVLEREDAVAQYRKVMGATDPAKADAAKVKGVPLLIVWGDFMDKSPVWPKIRPNPEKWAAAIKAAGGTVDTFDLPKMGIKGNTHMLMMDKNSDDIAKLVHDWIAKQGLVN